MISRSLCLVAALCASNLAFGALSEHFSLNDGTAMQMVAGQSTKLSLHIYDPVATDAVHHIHPMHGKPAHLIVVRDDLSTFAHIHPSQMDEHHPMFEMMLNTATNDPDNADAPIAVPKAGRYFFFTEVMPMGYSMTTLPEDVTATGATASDTPFALDPVVDGAIVKELGPYRVSLKIETYPECGTFSVLLRAMVELKDQNGNYSPVKDLQPWLESFGHAILISRDGTTAATKLFSHLHGVWPLPDDPTGPRGPDIELTSDNHQPMKAGDFKVWVQTKHAGHVLTVPFAVTITKPVEVAKCK